MTILDVVLAILIAWVCIMSTMLIIYAAIAGHYFDIGPFKSRTPAPTNDLKHWLPGAIAELNKLSPEQRDRAINCHKHHSGPISAVMIKTWIKRYVSQPPERQHA